MEVRAIGKYLRVPPKKARLIVDQVRGKPAVEAMTALKFMPNKAARIVFKVLKSAVANAIENLRLDEDTLCIQTVMVDDGPRIKRIQPRAMGRAFRILKRMSHITVVLEDSIVPVSKPKRAKTEPKKDSKDVKATKKQVTADEKPEKTEKKKTEQSVKAEVPANETIENVVTAQETVETTEPITTETNKVSDNTDKTE